MKNYYAHLKLHFSDRSFLRSILIAVLLLSVGLVINYYAGTYATKSESGSVTDIILSNTQPHDVDGVFVMGSYILLGLIVFLVFRKVNTLPYTLEAISLFVMIRSIFVSLTHIGSFPTQISINSDLLSRVSFGGDLFFSGHTGLPFLMALIYWRVPYIRNIFLALSLAFGVIVLMGHLHYSIDVLSAFFITYSIYHIAERMFKKDRRLFYDGVKNTL
jgi:divalent metal cation (Fe/Co/Zn/Cd) transporter